MPAMLGRIGIAPDAKIARICDPKTSRFRDSAKYNGLMPRRSRANTNNLECGSQIARPNIPSSARIASAPRLMYSLSTISVSE